jgi:hypothetical protein
MNSVTLSKRNIFIVITTTIVISVSILILQILIPTTLEPQNSPSSGEDSAVSLVATHAVENFFTVDYQEGKDVWLKRVCASSTASGCQFLSQGIDPMWERINSSKSVVKAQVVTVEKVADNSLEQVWVTTLKLSSPLPGTNKTQDKAYVVIEKAATGWKFDRFLLPPEIQALQERQNFNNGKTQEEEAR